MNGRKQIAELEVSDGSNKLKILMPYRASNIVFHIENVLILSSTGCRCSGCSDPELHQVQPWAACLLKFSFSSISSTIWQFWHENHVWNVNFDVFDTFFDAKSMLPGIPCGIVPGIIICWGGSCPPIWFWHHNFWNEIWSKSCGNYVLRSLKNVFLHQNFVWWQSEIIWHC